MSTREEQDRPIRHTVPKGQRLHIALMGRTNVGKSSVLNLLAGQDVAVTSPVPGTTTDVVEKTMELLPLGPVVFLDAPGLGDTTELGVRRRVRAERLFDRADVILLVREWGVDGEPEQEVVRRAAERGIPVVPVYNKADLTPPPPGTEGVYCAALEAGSRDRVLADLKQALLRVCPEEFLRPPPLVGDLLPAGGLAVLIVPIDLQAPKGRLILPQVQTIREALDGDAIVVVVKERDYAAALARLRTPPDLAVCDSQVVHKMVADTPPGVPCTTFSILMARLKGDLPRFAAGAAAIDRLRDGDRILIAESCTHHALEDDIGRKKIPRWLAEYTRARLEVEVCSGQDFPADLGRYRLVIQCGGCMHNRRTMLTRLETCTAAGVPMTNYGLCIAHTQGVLRRVLSPFPSALEAFEKAAERNSTARPA